MAATKNKRPRNGVLILLGALSLVAANVLGSNIHWIGGVDSQWMTPGNWSSNAVPGSGDDVALNEMPNGAPYTVTLSGDQTINSITTDTTSGLAVIMAGSLTIANDSVVNGPFILDVANIFGNGDLTLNGANIWRSASLIGNGVINIGPTATVMLDLHPSQGIESYKTINNSGVFNDEGARRYEDYAIFNNEATGVYNVSVDGLGDGIFNNSGQFNKIGESTIESYATFNNEATGVVNVANGHLELAATVTNSGSLSVAKGATLSLEAGLTANAGSVGGAGTIDLSGDWYTFAPGTFNPTGTLNINASATINNAISPAMLGPMGSGIITFNAPLNYSGAVSVTSGDLVFNADETLTSLSLSSISKLGGAGTVNISKSFNWSGSLERGSGGVVTTGAMNVTGNPSIETSLENDGATTWNAPLLTMSSGTIINKGTFSISNSSEVDFRGISFTNSVSNSGSFIKQGSGTAAFWRNANNASMDFDNSGRMEIEGGKLLFAAVRDVSNAASLSNSGIIKIDPGATLETQGPLANSGTIDIAGGMVLLDQGLASADVRAQLQSGYDHGLWDGPGIKSSLAANYPYHAGAVGYSVNGISYTLKTTWLGDVNLDGVVNVADFLMIAPFGTTNALWSQGDLNYDGTINANDLSLFMLGIAVYQQNLPEPVTGLILLMPIVIDAGSRKCQRMPRRSGFTGSY